MGGGEGERGGAGRRERERGVGAGGAGCIAGTPALPPSQHTRTQGFNPITSQPVKCLRTVVEKVPGHVLVSFPKGFGRDEGLVGALGALGVS